MARILIVDDNAQTRKMLRRHLKKFDYGVSEAENGERALEEIKDNLPDVVLLDIMMPDMSGFEVCERLRQTSQSDLTYIIMVTGVTTEEHKIQGLDLGADDYVTKPFHVPELLARVRVGLRTVQKKREAVIDQLTKLYNKHFFEMTLTQEISRAQRYQQHLSLVIGDLDHFKEVNDTYGHLTGDKVLRELGKIIRHYCRQSDIPVRWGGEEFAILLPETDLAGGEALAERIHQTIGTYQFEGVPHITASFGVATLTSDAQDLLSRADAALYEAKKQGRNQVHVSA